MTTKRINTLLTLALLVLVLGSTAWIVRANARPEPEGELYWEITLAGQRYATGRLLATDDSREIAVPLKRGGIARVVFNRGTISILPMPAELCPLGICSKMGPISRPGEAIICMPNKMVIRIFKGDITRP
ncbi:NusG, domain 2 [Moorella glycerini]|uniref:NusG domain-containing protein n=1 Tax=Neomoorella stamsii TaxID=1266720 RepID=A0A9X7J3H3_9FIRM|nr:MULTISPECIES: NusG domain II-containing protein [Moorella]PRR74344.1 hypothetical protein MOST_11060 [Moorella stamsii]CEP66751.1 NusG, domain 2 [Moorella glycerini]